MDLRRALIALALLLPANAQDLFLAPKSPTKAQTLLSKSKSANQQAKGVPGSQTNHIAANTWRTFTISPSIDKLRCLDVTSSGTLQLWECNGLESQLFYFDTGSNQLRWAGDGTKCVDAGSNMEEGTTLYLWDCNGGAQQTWGYDSQSQTIYLSLSQGARDASVCMDLAGGATDLGTKIQIWGCNGWSNQMWSLEVGITIRTQFGFVYHDQDFCLDLPGGDTTNGVKVQLWTCNGLYNQKWFFDKGFIHPVGDDSKCLDSGSGSQAGTQLFIWDCNGTPQQQWGYDWNAMTIYLPNSAGTSDASLCMDLAGGELVDGTGIQVWNCNSCWNQIFSVVGPSSNLAAPLSSPVPKQEPRVARNASTAKSQRIALMERSRSANNSACPSYPSPAVSGHCMSEAQTGYPVFNNQQDLSNSPWGTYFQLVYGEIPSTGYPICIANLMLIYSDPAAQAGVNFPQQKISYCPTQRGDYYSVMGWSEPGFTWIWNPILSQPYDEQGGTTGLPGYIWVEVMHMGYPQDGEASWLYYTPGSAIWMYLGATAVYWDHPDASQDLLGQGCGQNPGDLPNECEFDFAQWYTAAIDRGLDSFQFLGHADARCGSGSGNMAIEIIDVRGPGRHSCSGYSGTSRFRAGWEAKNLCECDDSKHTLNCDGFGMWQ